MKDFASTVDLNPSPIPRLQSAEIISLEDWRMLKDLKRHVENFGNSFANHLDILTRILTILKFTNEGIREMNSKFDALSASIDALNSKVDEQLAAKDATIADLTAKLAAAPVAEDDTADIAALQEKVDAEAAKITPAPAEAPVQADPNAPAAEQPAQ